ncbi:hypothetical protein BT69DRAFT_1327889 [Atractiella rhizophila]|nr:hypothetical protein BT69DRAFT_1327889 [Atractiella rhizophila]
MAPSNRKDLDSTASREEDTSDSRANIRPKMQQKQSLSDRSSELGMERESGSESDDSEGSEEEESEEDEEDEEDKGFIVPDDEVETEGSEEGASEDEEALQTRPKSSKIRRERDQISDGDSEEDEVKPSPTSKSSKVKRGKKGKDKAEEASEDEEDDTSKVKREEDEDLDTLTKSFAKTAISETQPRRSRRLATQAPSKTAIALEKYKAIRQAKLAARKEITSSSSSKNNMKRVTAVESGSGKESHSETERKPVIKEEDLSPLPKPSQRKKAVVISDSEGSNEAGAPTGAPSRLKVKKESSSSGSDEKNLFRNSESEDEDVAELLSGLKKTTLKEEKERRTSAKSE